MTGPSRAVPDVAGVPSVNPAPPHRSMVAWGLNRLRTRPVATVVIVVALAAAIAVVLAPTRRDVDMLKGLPAEGVVASDIGAPHTGEGWLVTSGTLLSSDGDLWSGPPDAGPPDPARGRTGSAVLRAVTERRDFRDVRVHLEMRLNALHRTNRTGERPWDGVHLFLRYRTAGDLYVVDLVRRDGLLTIKRKAPAATSGGEPSSAGPDQGVYTPLASGRLPVSSEWRRFDASIRNVDAGVDITLAIDGRPLLHAVDSGPSAQVDPGAVGIRGDNADFLVRRFVISPTG